MNAGARIKYLLYRLKYIYGQYLPLRSPVDVSLELASACNMACGYCYHADPKSLPFKRGMMTLRTASFILEQCLYAGVSSVKLNWKGESTLNPEFPLVARIAKKCGFIDRLTNSNFKFPTERNDIFGGLACQTKVKVSYDSFRKGVFETQRAGGDHDLTTANIDKFYNWPNRETELVIQAVRTKLNKDEDIEYEVERRWPGAKVSVRDMVAGRVAKDVSELENRTRGAERQSCKQAHVRVIFNWEGKAFPCCPDVKEELCIGDINKDSLKDIFNGAEARALRWELNTGIAFNRDPCKTCSSFESYAGYKASFSS